MYLFTDSDMASANGLFCAISCFIEFDFVFCTRLFFIFSCLFKPFDNSSHISAFISTSASSSSSGMLDPKLRGNGKEIYLNTVNFKNFNNYKII